MPLLQVLYGKHAAALYAQAADFNKTSRFYYLKAEDAYYLANAQASFDDWRRSRKQVVVGLHPSTCPLSSFALFLSVAELCLWPLFFLLKCVLKSLLLSNDEWSQCLLMKTEPFLSMISLPSIMLTCWVFFDVYFHFRVFRLFRCFNVFISCFDCDFLTASFFVCTSVCGVRCIRATLAKQSLLLTAFSFIIPCFTVFELQCLAAIFVACVIL